MPNKENGIGNNQRGNCRKKMSAIAETVKTMGAEWFTHSLDETTYFKVGTVLRNSQRGQEPFPSYGPVDYFYLVTREIETRMGRE